MPLSIRAKNLLVRACRSSDNCDSRCLAMALPQSTSGRPDSAVYGVSGVAFVAERCTLVLRACPKKDSKTQVASRPELCLWVGADCNCLIATRTQPKLSNKAPRGTHRGLQSGR